MRKWFLLSQGDPVNLKFWRSPKSCGKIKLKGVLEVFRPAESVSGLSFVLKKISCGDITHAGFGYP